MKITKDFKGLKYVGGHYEYNGDIETTEDLVIELDSWLYVTGSIEAGWSIEAGGSINAGEFIEAGRSINAGGSIEAGWSIKAGGSIEAGWSIEAGRYIEAGGSIEAGRSINAGEFIEAGRSINAGGYYGISAGLSITAKATISCGLKIFAGICTWRDINNSEKTITCSRLLSGKVEYGILKETGDEKKKIVIDGKEIEISNESYEALKKSLL